MALVSMGSMWDLVQGMNSMVSDERERIIAWLRAHEGQEERAIAAGACIRGSTMHGELRDQAAYYAEVADALEKNEPAAWAYGYMGNGDTWLLPHRDSDTRPKDGDAKQGSTRE